MGDTHWRFQYRITALFYDLQNSVPYNVIRPLGQGGQGSVHECSHPRTMERIAVKVIRRKVDKPSSESTRAANIAREVVMLKELWKTSSMNRYRTAFTLPKLSLRPLATKTPIPIISFRGSWTIWGSDCQSFYANQYRYF